MTAELAPAVSPLQRKAALIQDTPPFSKRCVVTGGLGFVGLRLVEMLVERGAEKVVALDIVPVEKLPEEIKKNLWRTPKIDYIKADITNLDELVAAFEGAECVFHIAAAVGPFHPKEVYEKVNILGTKNVVEACKRNKVGKLVMASSPSTRFDGSDIDGLSIDQLPSFSEMTKNGKFMQAYAESKFIGEEFATSQSCDELLTIAVAPHQVYGPRDNLFLTNVLEVAASNKLRIFSKKSTGNGKNKTSFTHVDNFCHGLICAERALTTNEKCRGRFYLVTDGKKHPEGKEFAYFWDEIARMSKDLELCDIHEKMKLPYWFMMPLSYLMQGFAHLMGTNSRLSPFTVTAMTMHRWFTIEVAERDLQYEPMISFRDGWNDTTEWMRENWLPSYLENAKKDNKSIFSGVAKNTQNRINIHSNKQ